MGRTFRMLRVDRDVFQADVLPIAGTLSSDIFLASAAFDRSKVYVLKEWRPCAEDSDHEHKKMIRDKARVWQSLCHENIVPLTGIIDDHRLVMVMPYHEHRDVVTYLKSHPDADTTTMLKGIATGVVFLHHQKSPIVHGNIRGRNILIDSNGQPRLSDIAVNSVTQLRTSLGSVCRFIAPEVSIEGGPLTVACDIYSLGMTILEILTHCHPFHSTKNVCTVLLSIQAGATPHREEFIPGDMWDLLESCWLREPCKRPTAMEVLASLRQASPPPDPYDRYSPSVVKR